MSIKLVSEELWYKAWEKGVLEAEDSDGADDWEMVCRHDVDQKYGSKMYSEKLGLLRNRTFTEFYGGGVVD